MQQMQWNIERLKQDNPLNLRQALLSDEQTLVLFGKDFGKIIHTKPAAVFQPQTTKELKSFLHYASNHFLPTTIRGKGLSQGGQSLAIEGGVSLSMQHFTQTYELSDHTIWVDANASWADVLNKTLSHRLAPYALPYNCNLSIGGVLSAGGIGAASFKQGTITTHVEALEVIDGTGDLHVVSEGSPLYQACLGGQGRCGVIAKACLKLRTAAPNVKTFFLVYNDVGQWFEDIEQARKEADYLELFCSPSVQGAGLFGEQRKPIAQWLYGMHISYEYEKKPPVLLALKPWKVIHEQEESIHSYMLRHDSRFKMMKLTGQWDLAHPWYECFVPAQWLREHLVSILYSLPLHYANLVHVVPIANRRVGFTMFPESESFYELMILNPGIVDPLKDSCLQAIRELDRLLLSQGGKRYLSGYLGEGLDESYWRSHFGSSYAQWLKLKKQYDPAGIFMSSLFSTAPKS
ncbi:FAD-binding oxidoreductase [Legionella israelensis]|uniref:Cytokinin oxidase n=1 Tax=Legionella israelensis TaxID=454 RepID=A0A0W0W1W1_9GAMM|nr:FAD-binding oxidoreductase [Legionella israelensis]KTD26282.1 cytokinin oxidase [Legionella israelensis]QBS11181.1 FAD-binding oxidoreductase [Legionella israelensis]SCY33329.1 FAD/FMN-containing dehydrogenase [Legionella israelensis DSM 19235]STX57758.1 cytokinin oxidase [Legionella israelensis]